MQVPEDLVPIPTQPWDERPNSLPLNVEECRTALWLARGNISIAAEQLKVAVSRLRNFVNNSARLKAEQNEAREQLADRAEAIVDEALHDQTDSGRRDSMAKYVLNSAFAKDRKYGNSATPGLTVQSKGPVLVQWASGPVNVNQGAESDG